MKIRKPYFLLVPILIILGIGLFVATDKAFYLKECQKLATNCENSLLFADYLRSKGSLDSLDLDQRELSHMQDVKNLYNSLEFIFLLLCVFVISTLVFLILKDRKTYRTFIVYYLYFGGLFTIGILLLIIILSFVSFNFVFEVFHTLFFSKESYVFSDQSILIRLFPLTFFIDALKRIIVFSFALSVFFTVTGFLLKKRKYDKV